jgi:hypothetical protein
MSRLLCLAPCLVLLLTGCNTTILVATSVGESKPHLQYYEKLGWKSETRLQDSAECGAIGNDDRADIATAHIKAVQGPEETERQTEMRLNKQWHACMTEKGYRDTRALPQ